jgi:16S rRNA (guanine(966)-N(2))-methyltransferase RsmD
VKESLFNIVRSEIEGTNFLDLFGGTGQIGIEAASLGAEEIVIVDSSGGAISAIKKNISKLKGKNNITVMHTSAEKFLADNTLKFDVAFLDPPYLASNLLKNIFFKLTVHMSAKSTILIELPSNVEVLEVYNDFILQKCYKYGTIMLGMYKNGTNGGI